MNQLRRPSLLSRFVLLSALSASAHLAACRAPEPPPTAPAEGSAAAPPPSPAQPDAQPGEAAAETDTEPGPPAPVAARVLVDALPELAAPDAATCDLLRTTLQQQSAHEGGSEDFDAFLSDLASADVRVRSTALARVEDVGSRSTALRGPLRSIVDSGDANARLRALELLARIDPAQANEAASALLFGEAGGRQTRMIGASALARSGQAGLTALLPALQGSDEAIRREAFSALSRAAAYPLAALDTLFGPEAACARLEQDGCRELARALALADGEALLRGAGDAPELALLIAEARADVDADALAQWSALVGDPAVPIGLVRDSVIELRLRGLTTELVPAIRRLLEEPAVLGPRTVGALLAVAPHLSDAGEALRRCTRSAENLDVAATCAATRIAVGPRDVAFEELARMESILGQSAPAHALSGRLAAMVLASAGAMTADSAWIGRFDMPTVELLRAMAAADTANVAGAINNPALDDRTAIRAGVIWSVSRGTELPDAYAALESPNTTDARWLEIASAAGDAWLPMAERLAAAAVDTRPSAGALRWLHGAGQPEAVARWVEAALRSGDYAAVHSAILTARRAGLLVAPEHLVQLLTYRGAEARVETAAYRMDVARLLVEQGSLDASQVLEQRQRLGDGAPGFPELGLVGLAALRRCP